MPKISSDAIDFWEFDRFSLEPFQRRILQEAGLKGTADPGFRTAFKSSLDFVFHAENFFKDPGDPRLPLILEPWQRAELRYCQWGDGFDPKTGAAVRKPIAINSPRGFGKSVFSTVVADEFALHFPHTKIALFSTSQDQANDLMDKCRYFVKHSDLAYLIDKKRDSKTEMRLINGSLIKSFPQSEVTIRGFHPHIKIIDEKARIKREILESAIRPMGRKVCWLEIGISTPFGMNNNHYEDCSRPDIFHVHLLKPTEVSWVDQVKLEDEVKRMGDRIARQELYAEFIEDASTVFRPSWIEQMLDLRLKPLARGIAGTQYVMGVDFGKHRDYAAICVLHIDRTGIIYIDLLERHLHIDYTTIINRIFDICQDFNVVYMVPDGNGVGIAIMEMLQSKVRVPIYHSRVKRRRKRGEKKKEDQLRPGFIFTNSSKLNLVDETVRKMMGNKVRSPHHYNTTDPRNARYIFKVLENEMIQFVYTRTPAGNIVFGHPEDDKSHDDTLISLMLAIWGLRYGTWVGKPAIAGAGSERAQVDSKGKVINLKRRYGISGRN